MLLNRRVKRSVPRPLVKMRCRQSLIVVNRGQFTTPELWHIASNIEHFAFSRREYSALVVEPLIGQVVALDILTCIDIGLTKALVCESLAPMAVLLRLETRSLVLLFAC